VTDLTHLRRREIEVGVIAPLVKAFAAEVGEERAHAVLAEVIRKLAVGAGCAAAAAGAGLPGLKRVVEGWTAGGALELTVLKDDADGFDFNVTRCRYAELYHALGVPELGPLLSCNRDGAFVEGFDPSLQFTRTRTIMQGASHCDFRYRAAPGG
jgi:hypothetical protein